MRRKLVIGGVVLLVLGTVLILGGVVVQNTATSVAIPASSADALTPNTLGGSSFSATWSGAAAGTQVYLITGTPTCSSPQGVVTQGTGASGSLSASLTSGTTYELFACAAGSGVALNVSWTATGISILMIIGIVLLLLGVVLTVFGWRSQPTMPAAEPVADEPPTDSPPTTP